MDEVTQSDWTKLVPQQMTWHMPPHIDRVFLVPEMPNVDAQNVLREGRFLCKCHGNDKGSPLQWAEWFLRTQVLPNTDLLQTFEKAAKERNGEIVVSIPWAMTAYELLFQGQRFTIQELKVDIHYISGKSSVKWSSYKVETKNEPCCTVDQLESVLAGKRMRVVFPNGPTSKTIVMRFDKVPSGVLDQVSDDTSATFQFKTLPTALRPLDMPPAVQRAKQDSYPKAGAQQKNSTLQTRQQQQILSRSKVKIGRNSLCPCGSGKKSKHCCKRG